MALGTPCIGTDITGIPEMIKHEETGLIIPQNNPEALAMALQTLLTSENMRVQLAENARNLMETEFNIEQNAASLRQLFQ